MNTYRIMTAAPEQTALLPAIEAAAAGLFPRELFPEEQIAATIPIAMFEEAQKRGELWVAVTADGGVPVGFALLRDEKGLALLEELDVHPDHGRQGLGRRLLTEVIRYAAGRGLAALYLTTFRDVPWNAPFYQKMGFQIIPEEQMPQPLRDILETEEREGLSHRVAMRRQLP